MKFFAWAVLIAIILCALFVWPTLYTYEKVKYGQVEILIKTNRITGESWRLGPTGGWTAVPSGKVERRANTASSSSSNRRSEPTSRAPTQSQQQGEPSVVNLSPSEIVSLSGTVEIDYRTERISVELYNGNEGVSVHELVVEAPTGYGSDGWERERRFNLSGVVCPPYETRRYVQHTLDLKTTGRFPIERGLVRIVSAKGTR